MKDYYEVKIFTKKSTNKHSLNFSALQHWRQPYTTHLQLNIIWI